MPLTSAVITGAGLPVSLPFVFQLLRQQPQQLLLYGILSTLQHLHEPLMAWREQQATPTELRFHPFGGLDDKPTLDELLRTISCPWLVHSQTHRCAAVLERNVCQAVHTNVLLTRLVLQAAIAQSPALFVFISSDQALETSTVLGATMAAAEASVLEATECCLKDSRSAVVRFPAALEGRHEEELDPDLAWRRDSAVRAVLEALPESKEQHQLVQWPAPLEEPRRLESHPLKQSVRQPSQPLLSWLESIKSALQTYDNDAVRMALQQLWSNPLEC